MLSLLLLIGECSKRFCRHRTVAIKLILVLATALATAESTCDETVSQPQLNEAAITKLAKAAIASGDTCGLVVLVGTGERVVFHRAYGHRQLRPAPLPMERDTLFDLASLTKPIATATSIMKLVETGRVELDAPVSRYLPAFGQNGKDEVTVRDCLLHRSGLTPDNHLRDYAGSREESFAMIDALACSYEPRSDFRYSDVGFILLGRVVEAVSGHDLAAFAQREIFSPLKMSDTGFRPSGERSLRAAATETRDGRWLVGEVHDPRAYRLGGVAGHAGLFSTAHDLSRYARMLLGDGSFGGRVVLQPSTVAQMLTAEAVVAGQRRALGWDSQSKYSSSRSDRYSDLAVGHTGFTGVSIWIDPTLGLYVIVLGSRLHPDGEGSINRTAAAIGSVAIDIAAVGARDASAVAIGD